MTCLLIVICKLVLVNITKVTQTMCICVLLINCPLASLLSLMVGVYWMHYLNLFQSANKGACLTGLLHYLKFYTSG